MSLVQQAGFVSRRERGVRTDDPKQLFCIRSAGEASADEQPSLWPLVRIISAREGREPLPNLWPSERPGERSERPACG